MLIAAASPIAPAQAAKSLCGAFVKETPKRESAAGAGEDPVWAPAARAITRGFVRP